MLDTATKKRIDDCRDILVGKLPDPKAQIEQITIGLIYKFMDDMDKEAVELGGKAKFFKDYKVPSSKFPKDRKKDRTVRFAHYAWDQLLDSKVSASELLQLYSDAIAGMDKNPNIPQLFRDIFKNAYLPYRDPETLKLFLKTIGEFEYTHSEKLGDAFEYLLSVMGSQGDAGQFRTPRHIIDFLVAIIDPGEDDTILDPACGTAGFLISAFKHILLKNTKANKNGLNIYEYNKQDKKPFNNLGDKLTPDQRKKLAKNFIGYDISPDMHRLSLVNLYLHGFTDPHIYEYDTLSYVDRWDENYDIILANPPFMSPKGGIRPHKKFSIDSNRSEVLFVDYIAEHLNLKGKAGIIVPEGVIFQSGVAYKELRKMLIENYLYAVISLPSGVFNPYSGVKTSILLMDKKIARKRSEILFIRIDNDGYNLGAQRAAVKGSQLEEAIELAHRFVKTGEHKESLIAHTVAKTEITKNGDYSLSGERYRVNSVSDSKFEMIELSDETVFKIASGGTPNSAIEEYWNGEINWATLADLPQSDFITTISSTSRKITEQGLKESSAKLLPINSILISTRATIGRIAINTVECSTNQGFKNVIINDFNKANTVFVALMMTKLIDRMNSMATGGTFKELSTTSFKTLQIPLPPLSIQQEIVVEIEGYQKIINGAKAVVENYKPKIDIDPEWEMMELGEVCDFSQGIQVDLHLQLKDEQEGHEKFLRIENYTQLSDDFRYIPKELSKNKFVTSSDVVVVRYGATAGFIGRGFDGVLANNLFKVAPKEQNITNAFLFFLLSSAEYQKKLTELTVGGAMPALSFKTVKEIVIPIPEINQQNQIVAQIEKEQALVKSNKQLIEIFEQKIKDRIAKVWGE